MLNSQHAQQEERVEEAVMARVVPRLAGVLRDCNELDDYLPPALLLQLLFRLHTESAASASVSCLQLPLPASAESLLAALFTALSQHILT